MKKRMFIILFGVWVAVVPFLPISRGDTQTVLLVAIGLIIAILGFLSLKQEN